jgi:hypothetical protein
LKQKIISQQSPGPAESSNICLTTAAGEIILENRFALHGRLLIRDNKSILNVYAAERGRVQSTEKPFRFYKFEEKKVYYVLIEVASAVIISAEIDRWSYTNAQMISND